MQLQEQIVREEEAVATLKERTHTHGAARVLFLHDVSLEGLTDKVLACLSKVACPLPSAPHQSLTHH
jgi:hypothetical protein